MKVLLDENIPWFLRQAFTGVDVFTVAYMGWLAITNGVLLSLMKENGFQVLVTFDSSLYHQNLLQMHGVALILVHPTGLIREELSQLCKQISS